jgi:hypothetical protein
MLTQSSPVQSGGWGMRIVGMKIRIDRVEITQ